MLPAEIPGFYLLKKNTIGSNIGWDDTVTIGILSIQKSTDMY